MPNLLWFTRDLRLEDHPALAAAGQDGEPVIPVFILDEADPAAPGGASRWWLHHSLTGLQSMIGARGGRLVLRRGRTLPILVDLARKTGAGGVYCSRAYEPWLANLQTDVHDSLAKESVTCKRFSGRLLFEPDQVFIGQNKPFQVFTPFYRHVLSQRTPALPVATHHVRFSASKHVESEVLDSWNLLPREPDWAAQFYDIWRPGAEALMDRVVETLAQRTGSYEVNRDLPAADATSHLSPHLAFGEIGKYFFIYRTSIEDWPSYIGFVHHPGPFRNTVIELRKTAPCTLLRRTFI